MGTLGNSIEATNSGVLPQCPRVLFVGLGAGGQQVLKQVASRIGELRPETLAQVRFMIAAEGSWQTLTGPEMASRELDSPVQVPISRKEAYQDWRARLLPGCRMMQRAILEIIDREAGERLMEQGFEIAARVELYVIGDFIDPICSSILLPLLGLFHEQILHDVELITNVVLSIAHLSDPDLTADQEAMAYGALKELNYAMSQVAQLSPEGRPTWGHAIDHCYVVDQVLERDSPGAIAKCEYALEIIGGFLSMLLLGRFRTAQESAYLFWPRWTEVKDTSQCAGEVASLGYAAISIPLNAIATYVGHVEAQRLIGALLRPTREEGASGLDQRGLAEELRLEPQMLTSHLSGIDLQSPFDAENLDTLLTSPECLADFLAQIAERYKQHIWPQVLDQIAREEQGEALLVRAHVQHSVDSIVHSSPLGFQAAEKMIAALDAQLQKWHRAVRHPESVPELSGVEHNLRLASASGRPWPALTVHLILAGLLLAWLSLSVSNGWIGGAALVATVLVWIIWSKVLAPWWMHHLALRLIGLYQRQLQVQFDNRVLTAAMDLYNTIRNALGCGLASFEATAMTEMKALRQWRDTLMDTERLLAEDPTPISVALPYGERSAIGPEQYASYLQSIAWSPDTLAAEFLVTMRQDPTWDWRQVEAEALADRMRDFCEYGFKRTFRQSDLDIAGRIQQALQGQEAGLKSVIRQLRERSEPLIRRKRGLYMGSESRRRFLLVQEIRGNPLVRAAEGEGLAPIEGGVSSYLAVAQVELGVAIPDLLAIPRLFSAYQALADKRIAHGEPRWADLPELEDQTIVDES